MPELKTKTNPELAKIAEAMREIRLTCAFINAGLCACDMSEEACTYPVCDTGRGEGVQPTQNIEIVRNCFCGELLTDCAYPNCDAGDSEKGEEPLPLDNQFLNLRQ